MSRARVWAVVEGPRHDIPFYESLLIDGGGIDDVAIILASDLQNQNTSAGGKKHALKLKEALEATGSLAQENMSTKIDIVFFLDRDDDEYLGRMIDDPHIVYTQFADVEAEIVAHSSLPTVVARTFSLTRAEAREFTAAEALEALAHIWREWISLRLAAGDCGWGRMRFSQHSSINSPAYGPVDIGKVIDICAWAEVDLPLEWSKALNQARAHVDFRLQSEAGVQLLKGKWIAHYIVHSVVAAFDESRELPKVSTDQLMTACSMSVDYTKAWAYYGPQLGKVLDR